MKGLRSPRTLSSVPPVTYLTFISRPLKGYATFKQYHHIVKAFGIGTFQGYLSCHLQQDVTLQFSSDCLGLKSASAPLAV